MGFCGVPGSSSGVPGTLQMGLRVSRPSDWTPLTPRGRWSCRRPTLRTRGLRWKGTGQPAQSHTQLIGDEGRANAQVLPIRFCLTGKSNDPGSLCRRWDPEQHPDRGPAPTPLLCGDRLQRAREEARPQSLRLGPHRTVASHHLTTRPHPVQLPSPLSSGGRDAAAADRCFGAGGWATRAPPGPAGERRRPRAWRQARSAPS